MDSSLELKLIDNESVDSVVLSLLPTKNQLIPLLSLLSTKNQLIPLFCREASLTRVSKCWLPSWVVYWTW